MGSFPCFILKTVGGVAFEESGFALIFDSWLLVFLTIEMRKSCLKL